MNTTIAALMFPGLFALVFAGVPIAFSLTVVAVGAGWFAFGPVVFQQLYGGLYSAASNYILAAIPLFVLMGTILERAGIAGRLFEALQMWMGRLPGGMALATIAMASIFAAVSGVVGAVEIMIGLMAIPAMRAAKYSKPLISGTVCAGGSLGTMLPPTVIAVVYASLAQISVGELFAALILPAIILIFLFAAYILFRCILRPEDGPPAEITFNEIPLSTKLWKTLTALLPPLLLMVAVLGSLIFSFASPTEAAAVGVAGALVLTAFNGRLTTPLLRESLSTTVRITSMIMLIVAGGTMFTGIFAASGGGQLVASAAGIFGDGEVGAIVFFLLVVFALGFVLEWTSLVLICVPIFTPVIRELGVDPIWFATMVLITIQTSYLTPPMAPSIFYLRSIAPPEITYGDMYRGVLPFIGAQLLTLACVAAFPWLATWLPTKIVGF